MNYELHPDPDMGLVWLPSNSPLMTEDQLHAFPLTDDERSRDYRAWRDTLKP